MIIKRGIIIGLLLFSSTLLADGTATLKADHLHYNEKDRKLTAKGNVQLIYNNITVETSQLNIDIDTNHAWSNHTTTIKKNDNQFNAASFSLDLNKEKITLTDINITVTPHENKGNLYITSKKLHDTPHFKIGHKGRVTTCDLEHPHHFIAAKKYKYIPNKRLTMYNVTFYNKLLFIPIVFWSPVYNYYLGKRKIIWNFPVIGKKEKEGWGWFVQNTIDYKYENNQESSIYIDWFENKGVLGVGIKHHYFTDTLDGFIYGYKFDFKDNNGAPKANTIINWKNTYAPSPYLTLTTFYDKKNIGERINSTGSEDNEKTKLTLNYDKNGHHYHSASTFYKNKTTENKYSKNSFLLTKKFNNEDRYKFSFSEQKTDQNKRKNQTINANRNFIFPHNYTWRNELNMTRLDTNWEDASIAIDDKLVVTSTLSKPLNNHLSIHVLFQHLYDLDEDRVTSDIRNNNYLYKAPEITLSLKNISVKNINFEHNSIIARYQETHYNSSTKKQQRFPKTSQFSIHPNTYIFKQKLSHQLNTLPRKGTLSTNLEYNQHFFKHPDHSLKNSDQLYNIKLNSTHITTWLPFLKTNTQFNASWVDNDNNSPYHQINQSTHEEKNMSETLTLFYTQHYKNKFPYYFNFNWSHSTGINWLSKNKKWNDYKTHLRLDITKKFDTSLSTGRKLNDFDKNNKYHPLDIHSNIKFNRFTVNYQATFDVNKWVNDDIKTIQSSRITVSTKIGKKKDYQWKIDTIFSYNTQNAIGKNYNLNHYELQQINIVKNEHKRKLMIGYNKPNKEWVLQYQFNAFPDDPIKLRKNKDGWKMEGRFNQSAVERFN